MEMKTKKKQINSKKFGLVALVVFAVALSLAIFGMSTTLKEIDDAVISKSPEAILANAGLSEEKVVLLPVAYFDQRSDECVNVYDAEMKQALMERQFEWSRCNYHNKELEQGLVNFELGESYLPVAKGGKLVTNRGIKDLTRWFSAVDGKSANYVGDLKLEYSAEGADFVFYQDKFYPLDEVEFSNGDVVNNDGHNHLFTMNFAVPFTTLLSGGEMFEVRADDDTFVFLGDKLVVDLGGIHEAMSGRFVIRDNGEVYAAVGDEELAYSGVTIGANEGSVVRIFHADRDSDDSVFGVRFAGMNLSITDVELAKGDEGIQIAYDPTDPTYVAPLGESSVVKPDNTRGFIVIATVEGVMVVAFAILMAGVLRVVVRRKLAEREEKK